MPVSKRIAEVDPIMGTPGERVITTESHKAEMKIVPAGVRSHIYGTAGDQVKVLYKGMYYWVPRGKIKSAVEPVEAAPPADEVPEQPADEPIEGAPPVDGTLTFGNIPQGEGAPLVDGTLTFGNIPQGEGPPLIIGPIEGAPPVDEPKQKQPKKGGKGKATTKKKKKQG